MTRRGIEVEHHWVQVYRVVVVPVKIVKQYRMVPTVEQEERAKWTAETPYFVLPSVWHRIIGNYATREYRE